MRRLGMRTLRAEAAAAPHQGSLRIREACGTGPDGTSLQGIIDACGRLGMDAAGLRAKEKHITDLQEAVKPVILHLRKKNGWLHYVVLYALDDSTATRTERFTG